MSASVNRASPGRQPDALCIIRLSAIGDCCHALTVVRRIQDAWPATKISWVIGRTEHELLGDVEGVEFITFDKSGGASEIVRLAQKLRQRRFPILLNMHASMRANLVSLLTPADLRLGFDRDRARDFQWMFTNSRITSAERQHVLDGMQSFATAIGVPPRPLRWDLPIPAVARAFAREICRPGDRICLISPCSSDRFRNYRNWSVGNYAALIDYVSKMHACRVVLTGGSSATEREYGARIEAEAGGSVTNLIGRTTLKQLAALLERADVVVCPDSGPAHIATAVGTTVVGLYATSNRCRTGPYLHRELVADRYPDAIRAEFGKPVDEVRWGQRVRNPQAMDLITLDDVTAKLDRALDR